MSTRVTAAPRRWLSAVTACAVMASLVMVLPVPALADEVTYRINAGGSEIATTDPVWASDENGTPSQYNNVDTSLQDNTFNGTPPLAGQDETVPDGTPNQMFLANRWDPTGGGGGAEPELEWDFPVSNGSYEVRLYFAEVDPNIDTVGERVFDVSVEGALELDNLDVFDAAGANTGTMRSFEVAVTDSNVDIDFAHVTGNPFISGIEVIALTSPEVTPNPVEMAASVNGSDTATVTVTNPSDSDMTVQSTAISGTDAGVFTDDYGDTDTTLAASETLDIEVTFDAPATAGTSNASLDVTIDGVAYSTALVGTAQAAAEASLSASPGSVGFGNVTVGSDSSRTVTVAHDGESGDADVDISSISVNGSSAFSTDTSPTTLSAGESLDIEVAFSPSSAGAVSATLVVQHDGADSPLSVALDGAGVTSDVAFTDVEDSIFQTEIDWLASSGITKGCNPPQNTLFCPDDFVTRGQMAAFLHRALDDVLTPSGSAEFSDDDASVFETDIEWLGATGVTVGCNPPANTEFCPDDFVTRGQMAAFLHRALDDVLTPSGSAEFSDDDASVFETDIEWLAETGVTKGCNPPANTNFCPDDPVTREQMAAFLYRALGT